MRNPWGYERWNGDWSDTSGRWTNSLRQQAGHTEKNDGKFFMSFQEYLMQIEYTDFSVNTQNLYYNAFAMFSDDDPYNLQEVFGDGLKYKVHTLSLKTDVKQTVQVSLHTYNQKHYHGECKGGWEGSEVLYERAGTNSIKSVNPGSYHEEVVIKANEEIEIKVYTRWSDTDLLPHDWSLVTWSDYKPIQIAHDDGIQSRSFFNIDLQKDVFIP